MRILKDIVIFAVAIIGIGCIELDPDEDTESAIPDSGRKARNRVA